jgi:RNA polymerase sigma-70 factor (ECF subfamily)
MSAADVADEELMLRFQAGDAAAFDVLYARHKGGVYRYLLRQCSGTGIAEELAQDVWLNLIRARMSYAPTAKFTTYVYRFAHNRLVDHYRQQGRVTWLSADEESTHDIVEALPAPAANEPDARADGQERATRMQRAIAALPPVQREAFLLQQESGLSVDEIAAMTGVSFETAKSRLRYALTKLRTELRDLL